MNKRNAIIFMLLTAASTAGADQFEDRARVLSSVPEYERVNSPREVCHTEYQPTTRRSHERDIAGSIIGGITGGVVGAQIGKGNGNKAATAVGAITGAIVGDRVQNQGRYDEYGEREVQRCQVTDQWENRLVGYQVTYEYAGHRYTTRLPEEPGRYLPVAVHVEPVVGGNKHATRW